VSATTQAGGKGFDTRGLLLLMQWVRREYQLALARLGFENLEPDLYDALDPCFDAYWYVSVSVCACALNARANTGRSVALRELMSQWNSRMIKDDIDEGDKVCARAYVCVPSRHASATAKAIDTLDGKSYTLAPTQFFESVNQHVRCARVLWRMRTRRAHTHRVRRSSW
jgi:hypothetical protein